MQKRIVILLFAVCIVLAAYVIGTRLKMDREGPKITFENEITYKDGMEDKDLLKDAEAYDDVDGDVSDSLMIESVYPMDDTGVVAVYVAKDSKNNVTKVKREIPYEKDKEAGTSGNEADNKLEETGSDMENKTDEDSSQVRETVEASPTPTLTSAPLTDAGD